MLHLLISLIILVAVGGIVWWVLEQIPLPPPVRIAVIVIMALVAIIVLVQMMPVKLLH